MTKLMTYALAVLPALAAGPAAAAMLDQDLHLGITAALLWLATLAAACYAVMRRCVRAEDEAARLKIELYGEQQARSRADQALADTHAVLVRLVRQQESVRDKERGRIARDIHDDLGQNLLAMRIELSLMQVATSGIHPAIHQKLAALVGTLDLAMRSMRAIVNDLRPLALGEGLRTAMERQLAEFSRLNGIAHEFIVEAGTFEAGQRGAEVDTVLYRVLQESLSNVARHAQASMVQVALSHEGGRLSLHVRDNGVGMMLQPADCGCGLSGMRDRINAAGGELTIQSEPGAGTLLSLSVPLLHESVAR